MPQAILDIVDLHKRYGRIVALERITLQVFEGEMFGLLGPNGAGKTTLLSILSCQLRQTAGEARILGRRLSRSDKELRRLIGIVPQEIAVYRELSARENLLFFGQLYGLAGSLLRERAAEILTAIGLTDRADDPVGTFSGGMQRRLNLGAALMHRPPLLLLDEPTTGVDPQSRNHIFEEIRRLNGLGVTVIYTSHYMEEVQALCTRVGIIDQGRVLDCDTVQGLLQRLQGQIRFQATRLPEEARARLAALPDCRVKELPGNMVEVECLDVKATLFRLVALLNELRVEVRDLQTTEPNLERVFLHLTGRDLRD